jgi:hypothetical protein
MSIEVGVKPPRTPSLLAGVGVTLCVSSVATAAMAWPVIRSPRTMMLGREISAGTTIRLP